MMFIKEVFSTVRKYVHYCRRDVLALLQEYRFAGSHGLEFVSGIYEVPLGGLHGDAREYQGSHFVHFTRVLDHLKLTSDDVFVDLGCGKGRVLMYAAMKKPRKVVGVELVEEYVALARRNAGILSAELGVPIEVYNVDAATCTINDGTVYYLFNPFGEKTLRAVLENIRQSLASNPRRIRIAYYFPLHEPVLKDAGWLEKVQQIDGDTPLGSVPTAIWQNRQQDGR
jgi:SAM-dependent methyltransferase